MTSAIPRAAAVAAVMLAAAAFIACAVSGGPAPTPQAAKVCTRVASPGGSDRSRGSRRRPFRTAQRLVRSLRPGQTGCLTRGNYYGNVKVGRGGIPLLPITLRSYPGQSARVVGRLLVAETASFVAVEELYLDGRNPRRLPSPSVDGNYARFTGVNVTNAHTSICFTLGHGFSEPDYARTRGTVIERSLIHDCGQLPPTNHHHGIYVANADDTLIRSNWIYDNADRGVQLYPDAERTTITGNVIDGNGEGVNLGGKNGDASDNNVIAQNAIANSQVRYNVEAVYPPGNRAGEGNIVRANCLVGGAMNGGNGGVQDPHQGFEVTDNLVASPAYANRPARDFRLAAATPCGGRVFRNTGRIPGPSLSPPRPSEPATVALRVSHRRIRGARRVRIAGIAHGRRVARTRVAIRLVGRRGATTLAYARLNARGAFRRLLTIRPHGRRVVALQAVVGHVGRSVTVRLRVHR